MTTVDLDFETYNLGGLNLKRAGAARYSADPLTYIASLKWRYEGRMRHWVPGESTLELSWAADRKTVAFWSHATFEQFIWANIMVPVFGLPVIPLHRWHDTQASCAARGIALDLDHGLKTLRLPVTKDVDGRRLTLALSAPKNPKTRGKWVWQKHHTPEKLERVYSYNEIDVEGVTALRNRLGPLPPDERRVWLLDQTINHRGIRVDLGYVHSAIKLIDRAKVPMLAEFAELTGGLAPGQVAEVLSWVRRNGVEIPNLQKATVTEIIGRQATDFVDEEDDDDEDDRDIREPLERGGMDALPEHVRRALTIRAVVGSASVKKLPAMVECVGDDGRARGLLQYHVAATTGRWGGRLIQPQNFPRGILLRDATDGKRGPPDPEEVITAIRTGDPEYVTSTLTVEQNKVLVPATPFEAVAHGLRYAFVAGRGLQFCSGDYAGVEARLCLALAGQHDKTAMMAEGVDVYLDMACDIYGVPRGALDPKRDVEKRQIGKNTVLGCGFQMGWKTFWMRYCSHMPQDFAKQVIQAYRQKWAPMVPKLWQDLEITALCAAWDRQGRAYEANCGIVYQREDGWLTARLFDGKKLWYWDPQPIRKAMPWDPDDIRDAWQYTVTKNKQARTIDAYGGLLTENVVQALGRQLLVGAMLRAEGEGYPLVLTCHDELLSETRKDMEGLRQIMKELPRWAHEIKFPCEVTMWQGPVYKK